MVDSIEKEFRDFLDKKASHDKKGSADEGVDKGPSRGGSRRGGDPLGRGSSHGGKSVSSSSRRSMLTKSLSKEDLQVQPVNDFFADGFGSDEFAVDWDNNHKEGGENAEGAGAEQSLNNERKAHMARSRRLGPGDRRKEVIRRNSSRHLLNESSHSNETRSRSSSVDSEEKILGGGTGGDKAPRRGLNRRSSNRGLTPAEQTETTHSKKNLLDNNRGGDAFDPFAVPAAEDSTNKVTVKSLRQDLSDSKNDLDMSFSELPKEWRVNPAAASFLPATQKRAPNRTRSGEGTNNPRHRRNSLSGNSSRPQLQRRLSSRGGAAAATSAHATEDGHHRHHHHVPRRHSLMGELGSHGGERQRSSRGLDGAGSEHVPRNRTTVVPRRGSIGAGACRDRRPSVSNNTNNTANLTGETIAAMGGATIRW